MPQILRPLNSKELKWLRGLLDEQYGIPASMELPGAIFMNEKKEKLYLVTREVCDFPLESLKIDSMGLYIGALAKGKLRLTIEGSQILGPHVTKNTVALEHEESLAWLAGGNLPRDVLLQDTSDIPDGTFVLLRREDDWLGCGRVADDFIYNYVPKTRHVHATFDQAPVPDDQDDA